MPTQRSKKHPALSAVTGAISGSLPDTTVEVLGVKYRLRLLKPHQDDWVANNTPGATVSAALLNSRKPTIAAALVGLTPAPSEEAPEPSELPVEQLFQLPDDMDAETKEFLLRDAKAMRDWRQTQVLEWLCEEQDTYVIDKLYDAYSSLIPKHKEAMKEVEGFSKRTHSAV